MNAALCISNFSLLTSLGSDENTNFSALLDGTRGLRTPPIDIPFECVTGAISGELSSLPNEYKKYESRVARLAWHGIAPLEANIGQLRTRYGSRRIAMILGTSTGGIDRTEDAYEAWVKNQSFPENYRYLDQHSFHAFAGLVARAHGIEGPTWVISTACSSSAKAFASAERLIAADVVDAVIVGGVDALCHTTVRGFNSLGVMSPTPCRPFSLGRPGMNVGEAAAFHVVQKDGDGRALLYGVGESSDAYHMSSPHPEGAGAKAAMMQALSARNVAPSDIGYINAHGTGTKHNDIAEATAVESLFGTDTPVVSTKSYCGHTLGACGAVEAAFAIHALESQTIPGNLDLETVDPEINIALPNTSMAITTDYALSNAFAFGGNNASLLLKKA